MMLLNYVLIALAVMVGVLGAGVIACLVMFNKRVLKWYTRKVMCMSNEIIEDVTEEMF